MGVVFNPPWTYRWEDKENIYVIVDKENNIITRGIVDPRYAKFIVDALNAQSYSSVNDSSIINPENIMHEFEELRYDYAVFEVARNGNPLFMVMDLHAPPHGYIRILTETNTYEEAKEFLEKTHKIEHKFCRRDKNCNYFNIVHGGFE